MGGAAGGRGLTLVGKAATILGIGSQGIVTGDRWPAGGEERCDNPDDRKLEGTGFKLHKANGVRWVNNGTIYLRRQTLSRLALGSETAINPP
jgi:hypothetical protein